MAKVAEGVARIASGIMIGRRQRSELAAEIKAATRSRHSEVCSLVARLKTSRGKAGREQATEAERAMKARHGEVDSLLQGLKASRVKAGREHRGEAKAVNSTRKTEVGALLAQFSRERVSRRRRRQELATAQRHKAAAFMRDLTSGVAALRNGFAKDNRDRATAIRERLAAYTLDRQDAVAIWHGRPSQGRQLAAPGAEASHQPAVPSHAVREERPAPANSSAPQQEGAVVLAHSQDTIAQSAKRLFGKSGHRASNERHGGSK